jgi:hypothetical protein
VASTAELENGRVHGDPIPDFG